MARCGTGKRWGGFLDGVDRFDPELFRISPREAAFVDPRQSLLELTWEALEDAVIDPARLAGRPVGGRWRPRSSGTARRRCNEM